MTDTQQLFKRWRCELAELIRRTNTLNADTFAELLKATAILMGDQQAVAQAIGMSRPQVSRYCAGVMPRSAPFARHLLNNLASALEAQ